MFRSSFPLPNTKANANYSAALQKALKERLQTMVAPPTAATAKTLDVTVLAPLSDKAQQGLVRLMESLAPVWDAYPAEHLDSVLILPQAQIPDMVNSIQRELTGRASGYAANPMFPSPGVAVPCEADGELHCFVLLAVEEVAELTPDKFRPAGTVSTVIEEFLHVWLYEKTWNRRGYITPPANPDEPCEAELVAHLARTFDEYIVMRHKAAMIGARLLVDGVDGPTATGLRYAGDITKEVATAEKQLRQLILSVANGQTNVADAWPLLNTHLYRGILEPLGRNAATADSYSGNELGIHEPDTALYRQVTAAHWRDIRSAMNLAYERPEDTEVALQKAMVALRQFLATIGVTYHKMEDGQCYVRCDSTFFATHR